MSKSVNASASAPESLQPGLKRGLSYLVRTLRKSRVFSWLLACRYDLALMLKGARVYRQTGFTPDEAYQSMVHLHCRTRGYSNDILARLLRLGRRAIDLPDANGVLGNLLPAEIETITREVKRNGYYIFPNLLPEDICDELVNFALTADCVTVPAPVSPRPSSHYDRDRPLAETYRFAEQTLLDNPQVQKLISDHSILALAQSYLGTPPILDIVTMWWSTTVSRGALDDAAQLYHFDMDRIKWLKVFFYLQDVTPKNGPHSFVAKSHRRGGQPSHLLARGYVRIPDHEIESYYDKEDIKEIIGVKGTIFVADTRAFHKGTPLETGDRLVLQLEFCNNLFGGAYTRGRFKSSYDPHLLELARMCAPVYSKFDLDPE